MKRPLTTSFSAPEPSQERPAERAQPKAPSWREVAPVVSALVTTLEAIETGPKAGPAMRRADARMMIIRAAWAGVRPGPSERARSRR
jgi:hypothetical protein